MSRNISTTLRSPLTPVAVIAAALAVAVSVQVVGADGANQRGSSPAPVTLVHGTELTASSTLADWAATADHVITATVRSETALDAPESETVDPADEPIGRQVSLVVDEVHWSAKDAPVAAPTTFQMNAYGWVPVASGRSEAAGEFASRLEVGHTYLLALAWKRAECGEGETVPAAWTLIGSGAAIPADTGVLGDGEFEGVEVSPGDERLRGQGPGSVIARFAGKSAGEVARALRPTARTHAFAQVGDAC